MHSIATFSMETSRYKNVYFYAAVLAERRGAKKGREENGGERKKGR